MSDKVLTPEEVEELVKERDKFKELAESHSKARDGSTDMIDSLTKEVKMMKIDLKRWDGEREAFNEDIETLKNIQKGDLARLEEKIAHWKNESLKHAKLYMDLVAETEEKE